MIRHERETAEARGAIFRDYANRASTCSISAALNDEGIPYPGASLARTSDGKWLASAIHGNVKSGTGTLNNPKYIGEVVWGRTDWRYRHADSKHRTVVLLKPPLTR